MKKLLALITACFIFTSSTLSTALATDTDVVDIDTIVKSMISTNSVYTNPDYGISKLSESDNYYAEKKTFNFENGDVFDMFRYTFKGTDNSTITNGFKIPGNTITVHYYDVDSSTWHKTSDVSSLPKKLLYIDTDKYHLIISAPAMYSNIVQSNTLHNYDQYELPIKIEKTDDGYYKILYTFTQNKDLFGEVWMLKSPSELLHWNNQSHTNLMRIDLTTKERFSYDGYYYKEPTNYKPYYGNNTFYRHTSNYVGASLVRYGSFPAASELGYAFTYICALNQNDNGYWQTGPQCDWLYRDFGIDGGFYDTRFNTDFGENLIYAYSHYKNPIFINALKKYGEYFISHATSNHYVTDSGGWLVQDYSQDGEHKGTHCSLNHQLAELNFLYHLFDLTGYEKYRELADRMLLGIEDTKDDWILSDGNLNYALHYDGNSNVMADYPYLTYNDLYETRRILKESFGKENSVIKELMESKLEWMKKNNITGYIK